MPLRSVCLLLALLCEVVADPQRDCSATMTPLASVDPTQMLGRWNLLMGVADNPIYGAILHAVENTWFNMTSSDGQTTMNQEMNINGTCHFVSVNVTAEGDTVRISVVNITSLYQLLPGCPDCMVLSGNSSIRDLKGLMKSFQLDGDFGDQVQARVLYFYGRGSSMSEKEHQLFLDKAECLGFPSQPQFLHRPDNGFCPDSRNP